MSVRDLFSLENKVAIVTGAGQGIGKGIALTLAKRGSKGICVADINFNLASRTATEIEELGYQSFPLKVDVTKAGDVDKMVKDALEKFGRIDILINNAGVLNTSPVLDLEEKEWNEVIEINLKGVFLCSKAVARVMVKQKWGRIINISSLAAQFGAPGQAAYCASKAGVVGFTRALAIELAKYSITVNAICPGNTDTEMLREVFKARAVKLGIGFNELIQGILSKTPMNRFAQSEDIAGLVTYLASSDGGYITGQAINICGGRSSSLF